METATLTVFAVNCSLTESVPLRIELRGFEGIYVPDECITMSHLFQFTGHLDDEPLMLVIHVPVGTDQLGLSTVQPCVASGREEKL